MTSSYYTPPISERGFVVMAIDGPGSDIYKRCAAQLAVSVHNTMPDERISLVTDVAPSRLISSKFDSVILLDQNKVKHLREWNLDNDPLIYDASPYKHTIKLEADMWIPRDISHWWTTLSSRELHLCTNVRDIWGNIKDGSSVRPIGVANGHPIVYNALTYWRKSKLAEDFYKLVSTIWENWAEISSELIKGETEPQPTTDTVYSLAAHIIGIEQCTDPKLQHWSMVHIKPHITGGTQGDWRKQWIVELSKTHLRIDTNPQLYPVHYWIKDWVNDLEALEKTK